MVNTTRHRRLFPAYLIGVIVAGVATIGWSAFKLYTDPPPSQWLVLALLTVLTGSFSVKLPSLRARISVAEAFVFTAVLLLGPSPATLIVALDPLVSTLRLRRDLRALIRTLFSISTGSLAIWIGGHAYVFLTDGAAPTSLDEILLPTLVLAMTYFAANSTLIAIALSLERGTSALSVWRHNFLWLGISYLGGASVAVLLVTFAPNLDLTVLSVLVPVLVITYLTFRTGIARLEDATQHVTQLNQLHLSTIETLAMAVDAKDQITHGHIRRVQVYTVELAKRLGVHNESQLNAIQAAALLHDMGKLAIPEHILNKPGRLSTAEFDKIKQHADIGADLISSIRFPYPVAPIVRHHHENWNGSGYPAGLSGTDIPLGARILSVVDCFDALTSDRPYRPRLSKEDAFSILMERRGTMYDPLVVDTFISSYDEIAPIAIQAGQDAPTLAPRTAADDRMDSLASGGIRAPEGRPHPAKVLEELASEVEVEKLEELLVVAKEILGADVCAIFAYDVVTDTLVCSRAVGSSSQKLLSLRIQLGERVTGWTAANRTPALNSDAALDLPELAGSFSRPLRSTISVPIESGKRLIGVLTAYSYEESHFTNTHLSQLADLLATTTPRISGHRLELPSAVVAGYKR